MSQEEPAPLPARGKEFALIERDSNEPKRNDTDRLLIHEWGTFTVPQDANGNPIQGVNLNEEALPLFVPGSLQTSHPRRTNLRPPSAEIDTAYSIDDEAKALLAALSSPSCGWKLQSSISILPRIAG
jgi:hypothetical protein